MLKLQRLKFLQFLMLLFFCLNNEKSFAEELHYDLSTDNNEIFNNITADKKLFFKKIKTNGLDLLSLLEYGLSNSSSILSSRLNLDSAKARKQTAQGEFDINFNASIQTSYNQSPFTEETASDVGFKTSDSVSDSLSADFSKKFTTGTTVSLSANISRFEDQRFSSPDSNNSSLSLSFVQPLLRGFGTDISDNGLIQAKLELEAEHARLRYNISSTASRIIQSFWSYAGAHESLEILNTSIARLNAVLEEFKGLTAQNLYTADEGGVIEARLDELQSFKLSSEDFLRSTRDSLGFLIGIQGEQRTSIPSPKYDLFGAEPITKRDYELYLQNAKEHRGDLLSAKINMQQADLNVKQAENGLLPSLSLFGSAGQSRKADGDGRLNTLSTFYDGNSGISLSSGLTFSMPLSNDTALGNLAQQKSAQLAQKLSLYDTERSLTFSIADNYDRLESLRKQIEQNKQTFFNFLKLYHKQLEEFRIGKASLFNLIKSEEDLTTAEGNLASQIIRYYQNLTEFRLTTGTLAKKTQDKNSIIFEEKRFMSAKFFVDD